jgi:dTMP kinase
VEVDPNLRRLALTTVEEKKSQPSVGIFITFEGIDGSGKSTQADALYYNLHLQGYALTLTRDPGGALLSEQIRKLLLDRQYHSMNPVTELLLYEAARSQLIVEIIRPALDRGEIVLCDRFTDSTLAYQGYGRSIPIALVKDANRWVCGDTIPLRTYILDIPWEEFLRRRSITLTETDRMEKEQQSFYQRVREGYKTIAREKSHRVLLLDGTKPIEHLEQEILQDTLTIIEDAQVKKIKL